MRASVESASATVRDRAAPSWTTPHPGGRRVAWGDAALGSDVATRIMGSVGLGFRTRSPTVGPEQDLVDRFLAEQVFLVPRGCRLTILLQPAIETGFPDLVAVVWRESVARRWAEDRMSLQPQDLRLLHLLSSTGWTELSFLAQVFRRGLRASLDRLQAAHLVICGTHKCRARSLRRIFAVEKIIAVEAKIGWWRRALEQARNNTWFSSESHVLLPPRSTNSNVVREAEEIGVGLLAELNEEIQQLFSPEVRQVPLSYGSWLFNEWVWRIARHQGHI